MIKCSSIQFAVRCWLAIPLVVSVFAWTLANNHPVHADENASDQGEPVEIAAEELQSYLADLRSDSYAARMAAMHGLIESGGSAIDLLLEELDRTNDAEFQLRALEVLERLAHREIAVRESPASQALKQLVDSNKPVLASRAGSRLQRVADRRRLYASARLTELGAQINSETWRMRQLAQRPPMTESVVLDSKSWQGTAEDARLLTDLADVGDVRLLGPQINDEYLDSVGKLEGLISLSMKSTSITDAGMAKLAACRDLAILEIRYADISDTSIDVLAQMSLHAVEITGTRITSEGVKTLEERVPGIRIDFKAGAYLGVGADMMAAEGQNGCRLTRVEQDSAAEAAGLMIGDVITAYHGQKVVDFESLRALIAKNRAGDIVTVEWQRRGKPFKAEVELGAWD